MSQNTTLNFIRYKDSQILVRFEGTQRNIEKSPEEVETILQACLAVKKDPSEENKKELRALLNPISRTNYTERLDIDSSGNIFLKDTREPMPEGLRNLIESYVDKDLPIDSLVNFWELCLANPNETARKGFYGYISKYGVVITDHGYALLYKAVNKKTEDKTKEKTNHDPTLSQFVSRQYLRIKKMKKSPKNYNVFEVQDENGEIFHDISKHAGYEPSLKEGQTIIKDLGVLDELNEKAKEASKDKEVSTDKVTVYQPGHKGDHGMQIRLGEEVTMPRDKCDPDINVSCSYGLHVGSHKYVHSWGRGMGAILAVLVNPADVVALPKHDDSKIRVCRYFPYAEIERDENGNWEEIEHGYFEEDFIAHEVEDIKERLSELTSGSEEEKDLKRRLVMLES